MKPCTAGRRRTRFFCALLAWALLGALLIGGTPPAQAVSLPRVEGLGAIVMDYQTGQVYFSREADTPRPAASMTKLMSLYLVFEEIEAGNLSTDSYITASEYAAQISSDPSYSGVEDLHAGDGYQVDDLLGLIMTASCNGSVIALAEHISGTEEKFVQRMNNKAEEWGIDAHFADCCGFEDEGNAVSPRAMATIAQRLIADYPRILHYSTLPSLTFHGKEFYNTNALLLNGTCPGIDGLKSGTTPGAGFCYTGTASRDGRRIITVVMNSWSYAMRMEDTRQMLEYGFARRSRAEAAWTSALETLEVDLSVEGGHLRPFTENLITATFSGMEGVEIPCTLSWSLNGRPIGEDRLPSDYPAYRADPPAGGGATRRIRSGGTAGTPGPRRCGPPRQHPAALARGLRLRREQPPASASGTSGQFPSGRGGKIRPRLCNEVLFLSSAVCGRRRGQAGIATL